MRTTTGVEQLSEVIGLHATLRLVAGWGGLTLYVPDKYDPGHMITKVIGEEAALNLELEYGGQTLVVPKTDLRAIETDVSVIKLSVEGASPRTIAKALKVTTERVKQILQRHGLYKPPRRDRERGG